MGQLIKSKFGKYLGIDPETRQLKPCGPDEFSNWVFYKAGQLVTNDGKPIKQLRTDLRVSVRRFKAQSENDFSIKSVEGGGFAITRNGKHLSDRKGHSLEWVDNLKAWEIFKPQ